MILTCRTSASVIVYSPENEAEVGPEVAFDVLLECDLGFDNNHVCYGSPYDPCFEDFHALLYAEDETEYDITDYFTLTGSNEEGWRAKADINLAKELGLDSGTYAFVIGAYFIYDNIMEPTDCYYHEDGRVYFEYKAGIPLPCPPCPPKEGIE